MTNLINTRGDRLMQDLLNAARLDVDDHYNRFVDDPSQVNRAFPVEQARRSELISLSAGEVRELVRRLLDRMSPDIYYKLFYEYFAVKWEYDHVREVSLSLEMAKLLFNGQIFFFRWELIRIIWIAANGIYFKRDNSGVWKVICIF